jgi:ligand-binding sensor domain-containing protein
MHATWALAVGSDGTVWVGTMAGLYAGRDGTFRRLAVATGDLRDDWVTALVVRGADVFVGTYAGGVTRLTPSGAGFAHAHLGGGYINPGGLVFIGGQLHAATMEGLLVRGTDDTGAWHALTSAAPGRDVTAVRSAGGALWVASRRGIGVL